MAFELAALSSPLSGKLVLVGLSRPMIYDPLTAIKGSG